MGRSGRESEDSSVQSLRQDPGHWGRSWWPRASEEAGGSWAGGSRETWGMESPGPAWLS